MEKGASQCTAWKEGEARGPHSDVPRVVGMKASTRRRGDGVETGVAEGYELASQLLSAL